MKSTFNTRLYHLLLSITFKEKYWRSQLDFIHLSIQLNNKGHHEKKSNLNNDVLLFLGLWPKKYGFRRPEHFFGPLDHAFTHSHNFYNFSPKHMGHISYTHGLKIWFNILSYVKEEIKIQTYVTLMINVLCICVHPRPPNLCIDY